ENNFSSSEIFNALPDAKVFKIYRQKHDNYQLKMIIFVCHKILQKMSNCAQGIVRELSSLKALTKQELIHLASCKEAYVIKKDEVIFEEGERMKGVYCIKN